MRTEHAIHARHELDTAIAQRCGGNKAATCTHNMRRVRFDKQARAWQPGLETYDVRHVALSSSLHGRNRQVSQAGADSPVHSNVLLIVRFVLGCRFKRCCRGAKRAAYEARGVPRAAGQQKNSDAFLAIAFGQLDAKPVYQSDTLERAAGRAFTPSPLEKRPGEGDTPSGMMDAENNKQRLSGAREQGS